MRLKKYSEFGVINESFSNSKYYSDFIKDNSLSRDVFMDNLTFVEDMVNADVTFAKFICDKDGKFIGTFEESSDYFILYNIIIEYSIPTIDTNSSDFFKRIADFEEIKTSIEELKDRISDEGLKFFLDR